MIRKTSFTSCENGEKMKPSTVPQIQSTYNIRLYVMFFVIWEYCLSGYTWLTLLSLCGSVAFPPKWAVSNLLDLYFYTEELKRLMFSWALKSPIFSRIYKDIFDSCWKAWRPPTIISMSNYQHISHLLKPNTFSFKPPHQPWNHHPSSPPSLSKS